MNTKNDIIELLKNPLCVVEKYKHNGLIKYRVYLKLPNGGNIMKPTIQDVLDKLESSINNVLDKIDSVDSNLSNRIDNLELKVDKNTDMIQKNADMIQKNTDMIQKNTDMIQNLIVKNDLKI